MWLTAQQIVDSVRSLQLSDNLTRAVVDEMIVDEQAVIAGQLTQRYTLPQDLGTNPRYTAALSILKRALRFAVLVRIELFLKVTGVDNDKTQEAADKESYKKMYNEMMKRLREGVILLPDIDLKPSIVAGRFPERQFHDRVERPNW